MSPFYFIFTRIKERLFLTKDERTTLKLFRWLADADEWLEFQFILLIFWQLQGYEHEDDMCSILDKMALFDGKELEECNE